MLGNVDPQEIAQFDAQADSWWDKQGSARPLHDLNPARLQFIQENTHLLKDKRVLDIGCGGGILTEALAEAGAIVTGIDAAPQLINIAIQHAQENNLNIEYQNITAEDYAASHTNSFDIITCMELLEHVPHPLSILKACYTLLRPGGEFFLSTLHRNLKSFGLSIIMAERVLKLLPRGTHHYEKFIKPSELYLALTAANLQLSSLKGLSYNPFTHTASLTTDVSVNYLAYGRKSQ